MTCGVPAREGSLAVPHWAVNPRLGASPAPLPQSACNRQGSRGHTSRSPSLQVKNLAYYKMCSRGCGRRGCPCSVWLEPERVHRVPSTMCQPWPNRRDGRSWHRPESRQSRGFPGLRLARLRMAGTWSPHHWHESGHVESGHLMESSVMVMAWGTTQRQIQVRTTLLNALLNATPRPRAQGWQAPHKSQSSEATLNNPPCCLGPQRLALIPPQCPTPGSCTHTHTPMLGPACPFFSTRRSGFMILLLAE
jgi:hypothetical protein